MLKRFLKLSRKPNRSAPEIPRGTRVYAVGDIHGRSDLLQVLIEQIREDDAARSPAATTLVFLGDLVDRGPDSRGVIDRLIALRDSGTKARFLLGNHDEVFLKAASGDMKALRFLTRIGGKETILSYGLSKDQYQALDFNELAQRFIEQVPPEHVAFVRSFEDHISLGDYLFVHAGVRPGIAIEDQSTSDLRWIRGDFLECKDAHEKMVIHGHSITDEADVRRNRIGIDTGAFASGRLTAIGLEGAERWFLTAVGESDSRWKKLTD